MSITFRHPCERCIASPGPHGGHVTVSAWVLDKEDTYYTCAACRALFGRSTVLPVAEFAASILPEYVGNYRLHRAALFAGPPTMEKTAVPVPVASEPVALAMAKVKKAARATAPSTRKLRPRNPINYRE